jgi:COMPASS component SWD2
MLEHDAVTEFLAEKVKTMQRQQAQTLARARWTNLQFSSDGNHILISTDASLIIMVDAFECSVKQVGKRSVSPFFYVHPWLLDLVRNFVQVFLGHANDNSSELVACFTPCTNFVLSGSEDSNIHVWRTADGSAATTLRGHVGAVGHVVCSPKYELVASACMNTALWITS